MYDWIVHVHESVLEDLRQGGLRRRAMLAWIESLQETGPPAVVGSSHPWDQARGPNGEVVLFSHVATPILGPPNPGAADPPYGIIYIRSIASW